jgi:monoamine oxidase
MAGSSWFRSLGEILRTADFCNRRQIPTREGLEYLSAERAQHCVSRREFLYGAGKLAAIGAAAMGMDPLARAIAAPPATRSPIKVGIVGAGLAGLACAYELKRKGVIATLFDANDRVGGRCWSLRDFFPGQVAERGGEFIDTPHKTLLGYIKEFKLAVEDVDKQPGEVFYYFNGQRYPESLVVDEYRALVPALRGDLRKLSNEPTAVNHTIEDVLLDRTSLKEYLDSRGAGPLIKSVIEQAYKAEYGLEIDEQSCLNFLLFIHADRRSKFTPFGIFSDERYHVVDGNDRIAEGLRVRLPGQIQLDMRLVRARKTAAGKIELSFARGASTKQATFDAVVLALPFTTLREVDVDASLGLPTWKIDAIDLLGYGTNAKMMVGFNSRPWVSLGSNGEAYSDLTNHQLTWETNPFLANAGRGVLTDYSSGQRGAGLNPKNPQREASRFLNDLDKIFPGAVAAATRDANGNFRVHLEHWPSNPLTKGSYTCYRPGQFTSIAGNEGVPVGNLYFAGEHANSFYDWQGFMEGAALSGIQAAMEILSDIKVGELG